MSQTGQCLGDEDCVLAPHDASTLISSLCCRWQSREATVLISSVVGNLHGVMIKRREVFVDLILSHVIKSRYSSSLGSKTIRFAVF
jgi:hypothetical protein